MKLFGRGDRDRPSPERGDPIGGWCEHCGTAYAFGAEECPECHAGVASTGAPPRWSEPEPTGDIDDDPVGGWCPSCGSSFRPGITVCPDCGEVLTAQPPVADADERHDVIEYDLGDWTAPKARELTNQLNISNITFEWSGTTLHVPGAHEAEVDELVDVLDGANDGDLLDDDRYELPEEPDVVEYEFTDWTSGQRDDLLESLRRVGVDFDWDGTVLAVNGEDEDVVDHAVLIIDPEFPVEAEEAP